MRACFAKTWIQLMWIYASVRKKIRTLHNSCKLHKLPKLHNLSKSLVQKIRKLSKFCYLQTLCDVVDVVSHTWFWMGSSRPSCPHSLLQQASHRFLAHQLHAVAFGYKTPLMRLGQWLLDCDGLASFWKAFPVRGECWSVFSLFEGVV